MGSNLQVKASSVAFFTLLLTHVFMVHLARFPKMYWDLNVYLDSRDRLGFNMGFTYSKVVTIIEFKSQLYIPC